MQTLQFINRGAGDQDGQEVPEHPDIENYDKQENEDSPSGVEEQKEEVETVSLA